MNNMLEQIGITKEELIERIVNKALGITADHRQTGEETWVEIPFSDVVDKKITNAIGNIVESMKPLIETRIETIMNEQINKVFTEPFQPVTRWGEPKGESTTIRDMIADEAKEYWSKNVDDSGKVNDGYGTKTPRSIYYARKVMEDHYRTELATEVKTMAAEMKARIPATIAEEISKTVTKYLN